MRLRRTPRRGIEVDASTEHEATMKMVHRKYTGKYECGCGCIENEEGRLMVQSCPDHASPVVYETGLIETHKAVIQEAR